MTQEKDIEHLLAKGIEDDPYLGMDEIEQRMVPRNVRDATIDYANSVADTTIHNQQLRQTVQSGFGLQEPKKRVMTPVDHMAESLGTLNKTFLDLQSLYVRLLGDSGSLKAPTEAPRADKPAFAYDKKPVVAQLHEQADDVARMATEMTALIAQLRERI